MNHPLSVLTNVLHPSVELTANSGHLPPGETGGVLKIISPVNRDTYSNTFVKQMFELEFYSHIQVINIYFLNVITD